MPTSRMLCGIMLGCWLTASLPAISTAQAAFVGTIRYDLMNKGQHIELIATTDGIRLRQDLIPSDSVRQAYPVAMIIDPVARTLTTLMPMTRRYATRELGPLGAGAANEPPSPAASDTLIATSRHETVAGVGCDVFVSGQAGVDGPDEYCLTTALGRVPGMDSTIASLDAPGATRPPIARMFHDRAIVLRMRWNSADPPVTMIATKIDRERPSRSVFAVPPGYAPAP